MPDNTQTRTETFQTVARGQNGQLDALLVPKDQASRLYNVVVRNGLAETRPPFSGSALPVDGRFQGAFAYELEGNLRWICVVSGQVWVYSHASDAWTLAHTFPTTDFAQAHFVQAGRYAIVQNGVFEPVENWPLVLLGETPVDNLEVEYLSGNSLVKVKDFPEADGGPQVVRIPIGTAMAFGQGRLFVAVERYWDHGLAGSVRGWQTGRGLRNIVAGDDERGDDPDRFLVFTENDVLAGGGALSLPSENGFITSMTFFRNTATGTGLGELVVLSRRGSCVFAVSVSRQQGWGQDGFGQQLFQSSGSASPWALVPVNSDLAYYGSGGLRTIRYTASNETAAGGVASVPISPEVLNFTDFTLPEHEPYVTMAHSDNYIFATAGGSALPDGSVAFRSVLPWDLANFQVSGSAPGRVFAGAWTGPLFHAVLRAPDGGFGAIYRATAAGALRAGTFQFGGAGAGVPCAVRTGGFGFEAPANLKRLKHVDLMFDRVRTPLDVRIRWRADGSGPWKLSDERRFLSTGSASTGVFRVPVESDNDGTGYFFEFSIEWRGHARLKMALFGAAVGERFAGGDDLCSTINLDNDPYRVSSGDDEFAPAGDWPSQEQI